MTQVFIRKTLVFLFSSAFLLANAATFGIPSRLDQSLGYSNGQFIGDYGTIMNCIHDIVKDENDMVVSLPAPRLVNELAVGTVDVGYALGISDERNAIATASNRMHTVELWFLSLNDNLSPMDLSGRTIATVRKSFFVSLIKDAGGEPLELLTYDQAIKMAGANRVDGAMVPHTVKSSLDERIVNELNKKVMDTIPIVAYVSKRSTQKGILLNRVNSAIAQCVE